MEYIYCDEVKLYENVAIELIKISDKYCVHKLKEMSEGFLQSLTQKNGSKWTPCPEIIYFSLWKKTKKCMNIFLTTE